MSFFVVERSPLDSSLSVCLPDVFPTREAAVAALSAATRSGSVALTGEVFIADLSSAVPVLVMQPVATVTAPETDTEEQAPQLPESDGAPGLEAAEDSYPAVEVPAVEDPYAVWEAAREVRSGSGSITDALKRAASSLEEEGIVAPESVGDSETVPESGISDIESVEEVPGAVDLIDEAVDAVEESADLGDELPEGAPAEPDVEWAGPPPADQVALSAGVAEPRTTADVDAVTEGVAAQPEEIDELVAPALADLEVIDPVSRSSYESAGELDLGGYTCADCVYSNTCPKVGTTTPAACGSFQWKSE
ncbi:MAG: hypothetical protein JXA36_08150 [Coriobacteriia bacterium]|nr:hypothetical protein [Coriobacteriia bacterium]